MTHFKTGHADGNAVCTANGEIVLVLEFHTTFNIEINGHGNALPMVVFVDRQGIVSRIKEQFGSLILRQKIFLTETQLHTHSLFLGLCFTPLFDVYTAMCRKRNASQGQWPEPSPYLCVRTRFCSSGIRSAK